MLLVGGTEQSTVGGTCSVHQTLQLQRGHNVGARAVAVLAVYLGVNGIEAGSGNDGTVLALDDLILLLVINGACATDLRADTAFAGLHHGAVSGVDGSNLRHCLCKGDVDGVAGVHAHIELVCNLLLGALLGAETAARAFGLVNVASLATDLCLEVTNVALYGFDFTVCVDGDLLVLGSVYHLGGQDTSGAVQRGEGLVKLCHLAADGGRLLNDVYLKSCLGNVQSGLDAGDTAANDQGALGYGGLACLQGRVQMHLSDSGATQDDSLLGAFLYVLVDPGNVLTQVGDLHHVGVDAFQGSSLAEGSLVHTGRAGAHHDAGQLMLTDSGAHQLLTGLGAHVLIFGGKHHALLVGEGLSHGLDVNGTCNVGAAVTNKYANSLHFVLSSLLAVFAKRSDEELLGYIFVQNCGDAVGLEVVLTLLTDHGEANCLNQLGRLYAAGATVYASEAGKALVDRGGSGKLLDLALFYHINKLVGVVLHLVKGGAGRGAFAAAHALAYVHAGGAQYLFGLIIAMTHFAPPFTLRRVLLQAAQ